MIYVVFGSSGTGLKAAIRIGCKHDVVFPLSVHREMKLHMISCCFAYSNTDKQTVLWHALRCSLKVLRDSASVLKVKVMI